MRRPDPSEIRAFESTSDAVDDVNTLKLKLWAERTKFDADKVRDFSLCLHPP